MPDQPLNAAAAALIARDFEMEAIDLDDPTEEALFHALASQIAWLIDNRMEFLLSLMYRLDVSEAKVKAALSPLAPDPAHIGLTRLIIERQMQRAYTKQHYKPEPLDEEWSL